MMSQKKQHKKIIFLSLILVLLLLCGATYAVASSAGSSAGVTKANGTATSAGVTKAPDNLPIRTAKADAVTQIDKPDVEIFIGQYAAVKMVPTTSKELTVDYPDTLYRASVTNTKGNWKVHIDYIGTASKYPAAILHIPSIAYGDVSINAKEATVYFNNVFQNVSQISTDLELSSVFYSIPSHFKGNVKGDVSNGYLELNSEDGSLKLNSNSGGHLDMRSNDGSLTLNSNDGSLTLNSNGSGNLELRSNDRHQNSKLQISGFHSIGNIIRSVIKQNDDESDYDGIHFNGADSDGTQTGSFHLNVGGISINIR